MGEPRSYEFPNHLMDHFPIPPKDILRIKRKQPCLDMETNGQLYEASTPFVPPATTTLASASCWWCVKTGKPKVGKPVQFKPGLPAWWPTQI